MSGQWTFNWPMITVALILAVLHLAFCKGHLTRKSIWFFCGLLLLLAVTVSPLDAIGHHALFTAHMIQHITLLLIVPPLLVAGSGSPALERLVLKPGMKKILVSPGFRLVAWIAGIGTMWLWHVPVLFVAMKNNPVLHFIHLVSLLAAGILFIWPVFAPVKEVRLPALGSVVYLFLGCVGCTVLGIFLSFSPDLLYARVYAPEPAQGMARQEGFLWGLSPAADQQAGGLVMWVPACTIYVTYIMILLFKWFRQPAIPEEQQGTETE